MKREKERERDKEREREKEREKEKEKEKEKAHFRWKKEDGEEMDSTMDITLPGDISSSAFYSQDLLIIEIFQGIDLNSFSSLLLSRCISLSNAHQLTQNYAQPFEHMVRIFNLSLSQPLVSFTLPTTFLFGRKDKLKSAAIHMSSAHHSVKEALVPFPFIDPK